MPVEWEDIEAAAKHMFRIWVEESDLAFAKECWGHLVAAGLAGDNTIMDRTQTYLRLIALRLIYGNFCEAKCDEPAEDDVAYLAEELPLDELALGLLASEYLGGEAWQFDKEYDLREAALIAISNELRPEVFSCIRKAYGGRDGLYRRMSRSTKNDEIEDNSDFEPTSNNLRAYQALDEED